MKRSVTELNTTDLSYQSIQLALIGQVIILLIFFILKDIGYDDDFDHPNAYTCKYE